ncbi:MAG: alpha/beta hydrolase [Verrucomicrobiaceae bacterium]|nr:alpha/beta hydrolase [Verrucomicrobiaceae bacterium]
MSGSREPVPSGPDWQAQDQIINYSGCGLPSDSNNFTLTVMNRLLLPLVIALLGLLPSLGTGKQLPLPGKSFQVQGQTAFLILPGQNQKQKSPIPWVWYAPTLPNLPGKEERWMFKLWLDRGIAIAGIDVGESYGSPAGRKLYNSLHETLVADHGLAPRACLLGRSRGGLMLYNWASENPDKVACIAGIYPVCNLASWPGLARACGAYGLSADGLGKTLEDHNPIDRLSPLAKAMIPVFHIHGDKDRVVPLEANSGTVAKRYAKLGGTMTLKVIRNQGHNMWTGWFQDQDLVDFVITHATNRQK